MSSDSIRDEQLSGIWSTLEYNVAKNRAKVLLISDNPLFYAAG